MKRNGDVASTPMEGEEYLGDRYTWHSSVPTKIVPSTTLDEMNKTRPKIKYCIADETLVITESTPRNGTIMKQLHARTNSVTTNMLLHRLVSSD
mmetsp:Transcript_11798/g.24049  ORF Transcript_11798/g.24049 Transcript_11798/m.24049 type:complete len:94 (+) Transcript_11798:429-710(+)